METSLQSFSIERGPTRKMGIDFFSRDCCNRTRDNGLKLEEGQCRLNVRKIFTMWMV